MPKRVGFVYEKVVSFDNCLAAVMEGTASLKKTDCVKRIRNNPEKYARKIQSILLSGWEPQPCRVKIINEGTNKKRRELLIPTMLDHLVHVAIVRVAEPYFIKRYDFASCGSIPGRGQKRVQAIIKHWQKKMPKYAAECDVRKFFPSCKKEIVMRCLRRIFKDEQYLAMHEKILDQMGGVIAIGFQPSHWYGNLVLTECDRLLRKMKIRFVRYMDNYAMVSNRKRNLHKAIRYLQELLNSMDLSIKEDWQVFRPKTRSITMLCYRYYADGRIALRKSLMKHIKRVFRGAARHLNAHTARRIMSLVGILRHCHSYNFRCKYVYGVVNLRLCRRLISDADKKRLLPRTAGAI